MDFALSAEQRVIKATAKKFAELSLSRRSSKSAIGRKIICPPIINISEKIYVVQKMIRP